VALRHLSVVPSIKLVVIQQLDKLHENLAPKGLRTVGTNHCSNNSVIVDTKATEVGHVRHCTDTADGNADFGLVGIGDIHAIL
jgi:hypothetical protein